MAEGNIVEVGFINVVASPHPKGIYIASLLKLANTPVNLRGNDFAIITAPKESSDKVGIYDGSISVWTDIDSSEPSIDKSTFKKQNVEASLKKIFAERGFNNRSFSYVFDEKRHMLAVEIRNSEGKTFSIRQAGKLYDLLFSKLNRKGQTFEVTVIPDEDALSQVLSLDRLDKVIIVLKRPNPGDHHGDDAERILAELHEQNMKRAEYQFSRQSGTEGIVLNPDNQVRAEVAASNGHVQSAGLEGGKKQLRSTKEYPKIVRRTLKAGTLFISAIRDELKRFRAP